MEEKKTLYILVPGLSEKYRTGGLMVTRDVAEIINKIPGWRAEFVTTHEKHPDAICACDSGNHDLFATVKNSMAGGQTANCFLVTWGPLVRKHIKLIRKYTTVADIPDAKIFYYAQSFGWDIKVPPRVPIVCVSRYVMSQWAVHAQENYCTYIPPPLHPCFSLKNESRDIDVLVHTRKQNDYCIKKLIPSLRAQHLVSGSHYLKDSLRMHIIDGWIEQGEFARLLNRAKIFLYVTAPHKAGWRRYLPGEGFGLPALEAVACGALVGSNLLGGVTDFLTPGENCIKLQNGDLEFDVRQIQKALKNFEPNKKAAEYVLRNYSFEFVSKKWGDFLENYNYPAEL